ncbi:MAG: ABC transporter substrate-binding protein [Spirochaetaceae bacterium]|jgi:peptide/nickel transport system substrate-binding protein|nr:ABC transporter substrate-binding protein [Spirochaetaceae bacterium]
MLVRKMDFFAAVSVLVLTALWNAPVYAKGRSEPPRGQETGTANRIITGGEVRFGIATEPATLDPLSPSNTADGRSILFNVFEGLVKPAPDGSLQPAIAERYSVEQNGLVYTFTLRLGVRFHDGSAVTPEDVAFSLNTAMTAGFSGFNRIEKVETISERSVRITLKTPDLEFLPYLAIGIAPKHNPDREKNPIGTGPFSIASYDTQRSLVLVKNPAYWQEGLPYLDKVTYVFVADQDALLLSLQGNAVDTAQVPGSLVDQLDPNRFDILPNPSNAVQLLALNNKVPPLNDIRVRQAINYAVDVPRIIDAAFYGRGEPSGSPLIPGLSKYYDQTLKNPYPGDIQKAKALLAEAGYAQGFPLVITIPSNYSIHIDTGQVLVNQLERIGITATIKLVDWASWLSGVYRERRYEATIISLDAYTVSPRGFLDRYLSDAGSNFVNFSSPRYDEIYDKALHETQETARIELYKQAQRIISEEAASVYLQDIWGFRVFPKGRFGGAVNYPLYVIDFSTVYRTQ